MNLRTRQITAIKKNRTKVETIFRSIFRGREARTCLLRRALINNERDAEFADLLSDTQMDFSLISTTMTATGN